jgi:hypothetical protein
MDELKTIEVYTRELEALRDYDRIKKERDELAERCSKLETGISELNGELASLKGFKIEFVGKELTLEQAKVEFVRAYNDEIERRANEKFEVLKADLENKMPKLVYNKLIEIVKKPPWPKEIAGAIESKAGQMANEILRNKERWPDWFKEFYVNEVRAGVNAGLDAEFEQRVEEKATERAEKRLEELVNVEWPRWLKTHVKPKISELESKMRKDMIGVLKGPWCGVRCNECGTEIGEIELTENNIADLLCNLPVEFECANPNCRGLLGRKRKIRISLYDLIAAHVGR